MNKRLNDYRTDLAEADCEGHAIEGAARFMEARQRNELIRPLQRCRCELVDAMRESQQRVDRMDKLIRQA